MHNSERNAKEVGHPTRDVRSRGTKDRLHAVFSDLVQKRPYESITVRDIATGAHVSRSTFYEHFPGKDGLMASSLTRFFAVLADVCISDETSRLTRVLQHFQDYRTLARDLLLGPAAPKVNALLIRLIEARLKGSGRHRTGALLLPTRLAASQLAGMILAPVTAWLNSECRCSSETLALGLRRTCVAALQSLYVRSR